MSAVWFKRFGDIPGVRYDTPAGVDLRRLRRRNAVPDVDRFDGETSLWWETHDGGSTESPASEHAMSDLRAATASQIRANIAEVLELPGEPEDYHFALQNAASEMHRRRADPALLDDAHRLWLLDLQLVQAQPAAVTYEHDGEASFVSITALSRLLRMYLTEGRVADAAAVADIAERFGAGDTRDVLAARARAAALAAEDRS